MLLFCNLPITSDNAEGECDKHSGDIPANPFIISEYNSISLSNLIMLEYIDLRHLVYFCTVIKNYLREVQNVDWEENIIV